MAIVGVGGTGSYVLDLVAKTWVKNILLFDDDSFGSNTMPFELPGHIPGGKSKANRLPKPPSSVEGMHQCAVASRL